jgi:sulfur-carrier protein
MSERAMIRVVLPQHLRDLANALREVSVEVKQPITLNAVLTALETAHPALCGAIRDRDTLRRRALVRFFACQEDWSHESADAALPEAVVSGREPIYIVGAIAGGRG